MPFSVYYSDEEITTRAGFGKVARFPCIFDSRPKYHRLSSRYLIDRGLGIWSPLSSGGNWFGRIPTEISIRNYANWLKNFLEWAEARGVDLLNCEYREHIYLGYQEEMSSGVWALHATSLAPTTINPRVQQACDFLSWLADKGYRKPFNIPYDIRTIATGDRFNSHGHLPKEIYIRKGKARKVSVPLHMPELESIKKWLSNIYEIKGTTIGLMCEVILLTGIRREELTCLRVDFLPENKNEWHINNLEAPYNEQRVLIEIKYGTKGTSYGYDHGDKVGPRRSIWLPLNLADRLHQYRKSFRNKGIIQLLKSIPTTVGKKEAITNTVHLFLDEQNGNRISSKYLYRAWTGVELPFVGWSPHKGRDWWACSILLNELEKHEHINKLGVATAATLLESSALSIIRLQIMPQLGHAHEATSMRYLKWVANKLSVSLPVFYESYFELQECEAQK